MTKFIKVKLLSTPGDAVRPDLGGRSRSHVEVGVLGVCELSLISVGDVEGRGQRQVRRLHEDNL